MNEHARAALTFLQHLYADAPSGMYAELRALCQGAQATQRFWPTGADALGAIAKAAMALMRTHDVYVGVLPRACRRGTSESVRVAAWLWADIDAGSDGVSGAEALLAGAGLPDPSLIVGSGRGLHAYWRLSSPSGLDDGPARQRFADMLRRLARQISSSADGSHADEACCDPPRVLRLPGTWNHKHRPPMPVRLIRCDATCDTHTADWWGARLPALPLPPMQQPRAAALQPAGARSLRGLREWSMRPYAEGERHHRLAAAARWLTRDIGLDTDTVRDLIVTKALVSGGSHPVSDAEIEGILRWA